MAESSTIPGRIYQHLLNGCPALVLESRWAALGLPTTAYRGPSHPTALLAQLSADFLDAELVLSGIARREADGSVVLADILLADDCILLPLRREPDSMPFELVTNKGCLSGATLPVFAMLEDDQFRYAAAEFENALFLSSSFLQVVLLRALGLPMSLATGFDSLSRDEIEHCGREFGWQPSVPSDSEADSKQPAAPASPSATDDTANPQPATASGQSTQAPGRQNFGDLQAALIAEIRAAAARSPAKLQIIILGWGLADFDHLAQLQITAICDHLRRVASAMEYDLSSVHIWVPSAEDMEKMLLIVSLGHIPRLLECLRNSLECDCIALIGEKEKPRPGYVAAHDHYRRLRRDPDLRPNDPEVREAKRDSEDAYDRDVTKQLMANAMAEPDLLDRLIKLELADYSQLRHPGMQSLIEQYTKTGQFDEKSNPQFDRALKITDRILALAKSLKSRVRRG